MSSEPSGQSSVATPVYDDGQITLYEGDCRAILPTLDPVDLVVTDPPYGETSLAWDVPVTAWESELARLARQAWVFCSMRMVFEGAFAAFATDGWKMAQDAVWEKHNGSGSAADRFKRVHEHVVHLYRGAWNPLYNAPPRVDVGRRKVTHRKKGPGHWGVIGGQHYDDTTRIQRSVIYAPSERVDPIHKTQKPVGVAALLIEHSCPLGGLVLDPFAGSCSTLVAAKLTGRRAIGIELNVDERAIHRIAQEVLVA